MIARDIQYKQGKASRNKLDIVYDPERTAAPVIMFIHGGSWMSGSKSMYTKLGENFLELGYHSVIINYRLSPQTDIMGMIDDCRSALEWTLDHIVEYGGDAGELYLMGHSAGGHLAAVTALNSADQLRGMILIDAFGLAAHFFLSQHGMWIPEFLSNIFGTDESQWEKSSPDRLITSTSVNCLILTGGNTYPFLLFDNTRFIEEMKSRGHEVTHYSYANNSHMQMIRMFESSRAKAYEDIHSWIKAQRSSL